MGGFLFPFKSTFVPGEFFLLMMLAKWSRPFLKLPSGMRLFSSLYILFHLIPTITLQAVGETGLWTHSWRVAG